MKTFLVYLAGVATPVLAVIALDIIDQFNDWRSKRRRNPST